MYPAGYVRSRTSCFRRRVVALSCTVRADYSIRGGSITLRVRRALLFHALRRPGLDVRHPPSEQHIVLLNRDAIEAARMRRGET
jgi:hypothetical protein